jgi:hypothetical protein
MATRYAVASGSWSSTTSVWSDTDGGSAGNYVPADNDTFVICAGVNVLMNADQSGFANGMAGSNIIRGGATPGMLYFATGTSGHLKIAAGGNLQGTTDTNRGRLLANSNGTWGTTTPVAFADKAVIEFITTAVCTATNLDIALHATHPVNKYVTTYFDSATTYFTFDGASAVDPATDTITLAVDPPADRTPVMFRALAGGVLPTGIVEGVCYWIYGRSTVTDTFKLVGYDNQPSTLINITADGSGNCAMYTSYTTTNITQTFSVLEDVTSDTPWVTTDGIDRVILTNGNLGGAYDQQRGHLTTIGTSSIVVAFNNTGNNLDSTQYPLARIWLLSRNVSVRTTATTNISLINFNAATENTCIIDCEVTNTASHSHATQTTASAYSVYNHAGSFTFSGILGCFSNGITTCSGAFTASGTILGCSSGIAICSGAFTASGTILGCGYGIATCSGAFTASGTILGCGSGIYVCNGAFTASGTISGCRYGIPSCAGAFTASGTISGCSNGISSCTGAFTASGTILGCSDGITTCSGAFTASGTVSGCTSGINTCSGAFTASGTISGCTSGINTCSGAFTASGTISGCTSGINTCSGAFTASGTISGCTSGITTCKTGYFSLTNLTLSTNTTAIADSIGFDGNAVTFTGNTSDVTFPTTSVGNRTIGRSFRHGGTANDTRMWSAGGTMTHETTTVPSGKSYAHKFTFTNATYLTLMEWEITRPTNGTISIPVYAKLDAGGLAEAARLHWALVDLGADPLVNPTAAYLDEWIAADSTDWQTHTLAHTKVDDRPLLLRCWATRGSGNAYGYSEVMAGGAAVSGGSYGY